MLLKYRLFLFFLLLCVQGIAIASHGLQPPGKINFKLSGTEQRAEFGHSNTRLAVIVGVSEYVPRQNPLDELPQLSYAADDARLLENTFRRKGYQVITFTDFKADKNYILNSLAQLDKPVDYENSSIIFTFSGHGFQHDGLNYMALGNTDLSRIKDTALSVNQIKKVLSQLGYKQRILLIDACRNTPTRSNPRLNMRFVDDNGYDGSAVMYSTAAGSLSYEDPALQHGVFSYFVAQGIERMSAEQNEVTFDGLFNYVRARVAFHVASKFKRSQKPYFSGERSGDLILVPGPDSPSNATVSRDTPSENLPVLQAKDEAVTTEIRDTGTSVVRNRTRWKRIAIGVGIVIVGGLIASNSSDDKKSDKVTLILPTP